MPLGERREPIVVLLHFSNEDRGNVYQSPFLVEPRTGREALKRGIELQFGAQVLSIVCQCTDDEYLPAVPLGTFDRGLAKLDGVQRL